ncbi:MAG TPA: modification methylase [Corynebacterium stationis]|jgi:hypothetical protein|nr:modification methylase [Corynebacterium stationis]
METKSNRNRDFRAAQRAKKDEFYTSYRDIEAELGRYTPHFKGKTVYCNCDDPKTSNFFRFFIQNFETLGLKKLIATSYRSKSLGSSSEGAPEGAVSLEYNGSVKGANIAQLDINSLSGDGDFRSQECIKFLEDADIVVTNPPFSLFREYVDQLFLYGKQFLILGNMNALTYDEVFPHFRDNQMWYGHSIRSGDREFRVPDDYPLSAAGTRVNENGEKYIRVKGVRWFTNLEYAGRHRPLELVRSYSAANYPKYANFDAIEVGKTKDIPRDYSGLMGVPISFMDKFSPKQFEIYGSSRSLSRPMSEIAPKGSYRSGGPRFYLANGDGTYRRMYDRIVIRNLQPEINFT